MEFKKCSRCGCFFMSNDDVCCNCSHKDMVDMAKLNNIIEDKSEFNSVYDLSISSGISVKNLNRLIKNNNINLTFKL